MHRRTVVCMWNHSSVVVDCKLRPHKVNGYQCQLSLSTDRNRLNKSNRGKSNPITVRVYGSVKEEQKADVGCFGLSDCLGRDSVMYCVGEGGSRTKPRRAAPRAKRSFSHGHDVTTFTATIDGQTEASVCNYRLSIVYSIITEIQPRDYR